MAPRDDGASGVGDAGVGGGSGGGSGVGAADDDAPDHAVDDDERGGCRCIIQWAGATWRQATRLSLGTE